MISSLHASIRAYVKEYGWKGAIPASLVGLFSVFLLLVVAGLWELGSRPLAALPAVMTSTLQEPTAPNPDVLEIIQASPKGKLQSAQLDQEIVVVFNQPMVPIGKVSDADRKAFRIEPALSGKYRWYGTRVAAFIPDAPLKPGSSYRVIVPAQKSLNGKELKKEYSFDFRTPPLTLHYSYPYSGSPIKYDQSFTLYFNYPVSLRDIQRMGKLYANGREVSFSVSYPEKDEDSDEESQQSTVIIKPNSELPRNAAIQVFLKKGLPPAGGNDGLESDAVIKFQTYGPLSVDLDRKGKYFQDTWSTGLRFNNPVDPAKAIKHIRIEPSLSRSTPEEDEVSFLSIREWPVKAGQKLTIYVDGDVTDVMGNRLGEKKIFQLKLPAYRPDFGMSYSDSDVVESALKQLLPASMAAIPQYSLGQKQLSVSEIQGYAAARNSSDYLRNISYQKKDIKTGLSENDSATVGVDLAPFLKNKRGWLAVDVSAKTINWQGKDQVEHSRRIVQSTDLGMIAKESPNGVHVWVHSLKTNSPVKGATVQAFNGGEAQGSCSTDASGYCKVERSQKHLASSSLVIAKTADDAAFLTAKDHYRYTWSVSSSFDYNAGYPDLKGTIEFDRKLYRPGEEVHIKGFFALLANGKLRPLSAPVGKVRITVTNSNGAEMANRIISGSPEGGVDLSIKTEADAPLGHYSVRARLVEVQGRNVESDRSFPDRQLVDTFQVEEFRPATFSADIDGVRDSTNGETLSIVATGRYLFGAPMSGAKTVLSVYSKHNDIYVERFGDFAFGDFEYDPYEDTGFGLVSRTDGVLDPQGQFKQTFNTSLAQKKEVVIETENAGNIRLVPHRALRVENQVKDAGDRSVTSTKETTVYAANVFPGIKRDRYFVSAGQSATFQIVALDTRNNSKSESVDMQVFQKIYRTTDTKGPGGSTKRETTVTIKRVAQSSVRTGDKPVTYTFKPEESGIYFIVARTSGGAFARVPFYVSGAGYGYWSMYDDDRVDIIPERLDYKPGETAKVLIQSPYTKATAIVTVERERVFEQRTIQLTSSAQSVEIPIKAEYLPEVHVGVMIIRGRTDEKPTRTEDPGKPQFKMGMVRLNVSSESKRIPVSIKTSCNPCKPGMTVKTTIQTAPEAEVSLSVADRAVLDLLNYRYSDPIQAMYSGWPLGVRVLENRGALIDQLLLATKGENPGGGGDDEGGGGFGLDSDSSTRRNFRFTAYWNPKLKADKSGKIEFEFQLPDNLTTFRFMALAARNGSYGKGEMEIQVKRDVVIQKLIPRFIRPGDKLQLGSLVINSTTGDVNLDLAMSLPGLQCKGELKQKVSLDPGQTKEVTSTCSLPIPEDKKNLPSSGSILKGTFKASGSGQTLDAMEFQFPVRIETYREAFATTGMVAKDSTAEEFLSIPDPEENPAELHAQLSSTALQALEGSFQYFEAYPYMCLEQRSSAYLISLVTPEKFLPAKFFNEYSAKQLESVVLDSLAEFQNPDGGFRLWKEYAQLRTSPYLTAYVYLVMQEAKKRNRPVPSAVMARAEKYLRTYAKSPGKDFKSYIYETLPLILYVFRDNQIEGLQDYLVEHRKELSLRGKAYLLLATLESRNPNSLNRDVARELLQDFTNQVRWNARRAEIQEPISYSYSRAFYSDEGTIALWLRVLTAYQPDSPLVPRFLQSVIVRNPHHSSSHAEALMALAIRNYHDKIEKSSETAYAIKLGDKTVFQGELNEDKSEKVEHLNAAELKKYFTGAMQNFDFQSKGPGQLYYTTWIDYAIPPLRTEPADEGIEIRRSIQPLDEAMGRGTTKPFLAGEHSLQRGKIYLVRLTVTSTRPLSHFILRDPLPSHSEIVNTSFSTESSMLTNVDTYSSNGYWWASPPISTNRDDAYEVVQTYLPAGAHQYVYLMRPLFRGQARFPAASAYSMYEPEIFGRTEDAIQEVE